ncbi:hypothetical protein SEVIR_5G228651v4 [Setaria viridis]
MTPPKNLQTQAATSSRVTIHCTSRVGCSRPEYSYVGWTLSLIGCVNLLQKLIPIAPVVSPHLFRSVISFSSWLTWTIYSEVSWFDHSGLVTGAYPTRDGSSSFWLSTRNHSSCHPMFESLSIRSKYSMTLFRRSKNPQPLITLGFPFVIMLSIGTDISTD